MTGKWQEGSSAIIEGNHIPKVTKIVWWSADFKLDTDGWRTKTFTHRAIRATAGQEFVTCFCNGIIPDAWLRRLFKKNWREILKILPMPPYHALAVVFVTIASDPTSFLCQHCWAGPKMTRSFKKNTNFIAFSKELHQNLKRKKKPHLCHFVWLLLLSFFTNCWRLTKKCSCWIQLTYIRVRPGCPFYCPAWLWISYLWYSVTVGSVSVTPLYHLDKQEQKKKEPSENELGTTTKRHNVAAVSLLILYYQIHVRAQTGSSI